MSEIPAGESVCNPGDTRGAGATGEGGSERFAGDPEEPEIEFLGTRPEAIPAASPWERGEDFAAQIAAANDAPGAAKRRKLRAGRPAPETAPASPSAAEEGATNGASGGATVPAPVSKPKPSLPPAPSVGGPVISAKDRHPLPWGLVIADVFNLDVHKAYARLEAELSLGDSATEYGTVLAALDKSEKNFFDSARLARKAKLADEEFAAELDKRSEALRSAARVALEQEKAQGVRSKSPTIQDIADRMIATWPDEVGSINARKAEMHGAYRSIEALSEAWRNRSQTLRKMADQFGRGGG